MSEKLQREPASRQGEPTNAPPGSPRKIRVLMERAARKEALFLPGDNLKRIHQPPRPAGAVDEGVFDTDLAGSGEVA